MKYTGPIFRPPFESDSLLLQVTVGCSHNKCTFCTMYSDILFKTESLEQIEQDLLEARETYSHVKRVFLVNADAFVLSGARLKIIANKINEILPEVETIAMYASVNNIKDKTDDELKELRALKINDLNIGIESGSATVLKLLNKGFTPDEAKKQLNRLTKAGIDYSVNIIIGAAGSDESLHHAIESSSLLNELNPSLIFVATLHVDQGSPLETKLKSGDFKENNVRQNIIEEIEFLSRLNLKNTYFFGYHTSNVIPVGGFLNEDKEKILNSLYKGMKSINKDILDSHPLKGLEGNITLIK